MLHVCVVAQHSVHPSAPRSQAIRMSGLIAMCRAVNCSSSAAAGSVASSAEDSTASGQQLRSRGSHEGPQ
jgi:hypothetical protein